MPGPDQVVLDLCARLEALSDEIDNYAKDKPDGVKQRCARASDWLMIAADIIDPLVAYEQEQIHTETILEAIIKNSQRAFKHVEDQEPEYAAMTLKLTEGVASGLLSRIRKKENG